MTNDSPNAPIPATQNRPGNLLILALLAILAGTIAGLVTSLFRLALERADHWRNALIDWAHGMPVLGLPLVVGTVAAATALGAWLVRRFAPHAGGSGIPHVEAVAAGELPPAPFRLLPVKFAGGWLAIGGGLALGREGPSVQMGATLAEVLGRIFRRSATDCRTLLVAGAGAGLATAFNAPIAGAVFVLEELVKKFDTRVAIAALGASAGAIAVARQFIGDAPDFHVEPLAYPSFSIGILSLALGAIAGLAGIGYNRAILGALKAGDQLGHWPVELRAALIGAAVGALAWFAPRLVGGGDPLTQSALDGTKVLLWVFLLRFALGAVSYAARTPGGLFAPMLVLGAQLGVIFGTVCQFGGTQPVGFAVVGMAAFFTAAVRAPLTGIVLVTEMTGNVTQLLPMLFACFAAMAVPTLLGNAPIYDSLRERTGVGGPPLNNPG